MSTCPTPRRLQDWHELLPELAPNTTQSNNNNKKKNKELVTKEKRERKLHEMRNDGYYYLKPEKKVLRCSPILSRACFCDCDVKKMQQKLLGQCGNSRKTIQT